MNEREGRAESPVTIEAVANRAGELPAPARAETTVFLAALSRSRWWPGGRRANGPAVRVVDRGSRRAMDLYGGRFDTTPRSDPATVRRSARSPAR